MNGHKQYTIISIFAGCGGSSLGYKWAGFKELLAIDFNENACNSFKLNFDCPIWLRDIKTITGKEIFDFCKIKKGELDILDGSPPCQGFSMSGKRQVLDNRNDLFKENIRLIKEIEPKVFIIENVKGMIQGKMKGYFIEIMKSLKSLCYRVKCKLLNAKYYNVPQSRERLIFIGIRKNLNMKPCYPIPNNKLIVAKEALQNIENKTFSKHTESAKRIWEKIKPGSNGFIKNGNKIYFNYIKLHPDKIARTVMKSMCYNGAGYYHWAENRSLSIEEIKKICSFPQYFKLIGNFENQLNCLGNSVPPELMKAIANNIKINILDKYYESNS